MKVAICPICNKTPLEVSGDYHMSTDYVPLPDGFDGHPQGLQWYCYAHMPKKGGDAMATRLPSITPPSQ
jgi:hypothetical protein